jgi:lysophospholipase L1-like esterase
MMKKAPHRLLLTAALLAVGAASASAAPRFLALGDSYTVGTGVEEKKRWVNELVRLVRDAKMEISDPQVLAKAGWSTGDLLAGIEREKPEGPYALVTVMVGVNNQFRGEPIETYRKELATLLAAAKKLAGGDARNVLVLSIPDYSVMPYAKDKNPAKIKEGVEKFNGVANEEAHRAGAHWIDVTSVSRLAAVNAQLVGDDGLHPSWRLHAVWARLVYPYARPALERLR